VGRRGRSGAHHDEGHLGQGPKRGTGRGRRWLTLEGTITLSHDPADVSAAVEAYAVRYRRLELQAERIVLHLAVDRVMGTVP
jgi:hypothetical protein